MNSCTLCKYTSIIKHRLFNLTNMYFTPPPLLYWTNCWNDHSHWAYRIMTSWQKGGRQASPSVRVTNFYFFPLRMIHWVTFNVLVRLWYQIKSETFRLFFFFFKRLLNISYSIDCSEFIHVCCCLKVGLFSFFFSLSLSFFFSFLCTETWWSEGMFSPSRQFSVLSHSHSYSLVLSLASVASAHFRMHTWALSCPFWTGLP